MLSVAFIKIDTHRIKNIYINLVGAYNNINHLFCLINVGVMVQGWPSKEKTKLKLPTYA